jgi:hypothetical protein
MCYCYSVLLKSANFWQISVEFPLLPNFMKILLQIREAWRCAIFAPFHCQLTRNCYMTLEGHQLSAVTGHTEQIYHKTNVTSSVIISILVGISKTLLACTWGCLVWISARTPASLTCLFMFSLFSPGNTSTMTASLVLTSSTVQSPWNWQCH